MLRAHHNSSATSTSRLKQIVYVSPLEHAVVNLSTETMSIFSIKYVTVKNAPLEVSHAQNNSLHSQGLLNS